MSRRESATTKRGKGPRPMSQRAYARHRDVTPQAVQKAIHSGRLSASLVRLGSGVLQISDVVAADREWMANTDLSKAQASLIAKELKRAEVDELPPPSEELPPPSEDDSKPMSLLDESAREKKWKASLAELAYRARKRELVSAREVEAKTLEVFTRCKTKLLGLPSKAKTQIPSLTREHLVLLDRLVREALEDLASGGPE